MINKDFAKEKIDLIHSELVHLQEFGQFSFQNIISDYKKQAVVERLLERIISRAIDINQHLIAELSNERTESPKDYKETFLRLADFGIYPKEFAENISKSVGARNILVHELEFLKKAAAL